MPIILVDAHQGYDSFYDVVKAGQNSSIKMEDPSIDSDDVAMVPFSSGTTGLPKGVMLTHSSLVSNMCQFILGEGLKFYEETTDSYQPRTICILPMFHLVATMITSLPTLHTGGQVATLPSFEPKSFLRLVEDLKPTFMHVVPPLVGFYAQHPDVKPHHVQDLKSIFVGAAPVGPALANQFKAKVPHCLFREGLVLSAVLLISVLTISEQRGAAPFRKKL